MSTRSLIQRSGVFVGLILLSFYLFYIGKGHTVLLDTNAVTIDGKEYKVPEAIEVTVDGLPKEEMGRAERSMITVVGPNHKIKIEVVSGEDKVVEKEISIPTFMDTAVVSIPAILGEAKSDHWVLPFSALAGEEEKEEIGEIFRQDDSGEISSDSVQSPSEEEKKPEETKP